MDDEEFARKLRALRERDRPPPADLKVYDETDDADSSVEHKYLGRVQVKLPRRSRVLVGYALVAFVLACAVAVIVAAWKL